jgi:MFS superfamily sulfate permease-like transporter
VRVEGRAFFLNAQRIGEKIMHLMTEARPTVVVLDGGALIDVEYTALKMLSDAEERMRAHGITLWVASLNPEVLKMVQQSPLGDILGRSRMFFNVQSAIRQYEQLQANRVKTPEAADAQP